jgi:predicted MFS family arabinose efflux permease
MPLQEGGDRRRWAVLGIVYLCSLAFAATLQCLPPLVPRIINELKLSHTEAGMLMSLTALPGIFLSIPAGMMADRYGNRLIVITSFIAILTGQTVFATGNSFAVLAAGRLIAGAGVMIMVMMLPPIITRWFAGREIGIAMGIFNTSMPVGTIAMLNILSITGVSPGWRGSVWLAALVPLFALLAFALLLPKPQKQPEGTSTAHQTGGLMTSIKTAGGSIWVLGLSWLLFNAGALSFLTFTPDFLQGKGYQPAEAGMTASAVMWSSIFISPLCGWLIDRYGRGRTMIAASSIILGSLIFFYPALFPAALAITFTMGLVQPFIPAPVMALAPQVVKPERLGFGFGVISTCLNLGIIIGPWAAGLARDLTGSYNSSYTLMAVSLAATSLTMLGLKLPRKEKRKQ